MGLLDIFKKSTQQQIDYSSLPLKVYQQTLSDTYVGKHSKENIDTAVYLLYCEFSNHFRWVKDAKAPDKFFDHYVNCILILKELNKYSGKYNFTSPTPYNQLTDLIKNYSQYTKDFISRCWTALQNDIAKLKTDKAKINKKEKLINTLLNDYADYMTSENIAYIKSLNSGTAKIEKTVEDVMCGKYYVNTIEQIQSIPNTDYSVLRLLQKAATEHKRNDNIDLAVECLKKSNQISDTSTNQINKLLPKEYLRVINYLESYDSEKAKIELEKIKRIHPEFWDIRIANKSRILETIRRTQEYGEDTVHIKTSRQCPICGKYSGKVFSISGKHKKYPKLPIEFIRDGGFCPNCLVSIGTFFDGINTPPEE